MLHVRRQQYCFQNPTGSEIPLKWKNEIFSQPDGWYRYKGGEMTHVEQIHNMFSNIKDEKVKLAGESLLYPRRSHLPGCPWAHPSCPAPSRPSHPAHPAWVPHSFSEPFSMNHSFIHKMSTSLQFRLLRYAEYQDLKCIMQHSALKIFPCNF